MKLQAIPLGATFLSSNLKIGLLAGIVGVSASTGAVATSTNSSELSSAFKTTFDPINTFLNNNISPHFAEISAGAKKIGNKLGTWSKDAYEKKDEALQWVKANLSSSTLKSGFQKIADQTKNWAVSGKTALSSSYNVGKTSVLPFLLNSENMRGLLYHGSEVSNVLKALGALLTTSVLSAASGAANGSESSSEGEDEDEEGVTPTPPLSKVWNLISGGHLSSVVSAIQELVSSNLPVVKTLTQPDINRIINFVLDSPEAVKDAVENMKSPKPKKKGGSAPESKWSNYSSAQELMDALIPPPDLIEELKKIFSDSISNFEQYVSDNTKSIPAAEVEKLLPICSGSGDKKDDMCTSGGTLDKFLAKFLESVLVQEKEQ